MICSSEKRLRFMLWSLSWAPERTSNWIKPVGKDAPHVERLHSELQQFAIRQLPTLVIDSDSRSMSPLMNAGPVERTCKDSACKNNHNLL